MDNIGGVIAIIVLPTFIAILTHGLSIISLTIVGHLFFIGKS